MTAVLRIREETLHGTNVDVMNHDVKQCLTTTMTDWLIMNVGMNNVGGTKDAEKEIMKGIADIVKLHVSIVQTRKLLYHCW